MLDSKQGRDDYKEAKTMSGTRAFIPATLLTFIATLLLGNGAAAADSYDAAVNHPGRSATDIERRTERQAGTGPALTGIGPGMRVVDVLAATATTANS